MFLFGLTISASISWLNVIDKLGAWTLGTISLLTEKGQKWLEQRKQALATKAEGIQKESLGYTYPEGEKGYLHDKRTST